LGVVSLGGSGRSGLIGLGWWVRAVSVWSGLVGLGVSRHGG